MQFNSSSENADLISDITFLLAGIDTNAFTLKDRTRCVNETYRKVWGWIFESYGGWQFVDDNTSYNPYAAQNLTSGTSLYALPTAALTVKGVEVQNSGGIWMKMVPIATEQVQGVDSQGDFLQTANGVPHYYSLYGDVVKLYPAPNYTVSNGIRVYFDEDIAVFLSSDTTKVPGFVSPFHRALSVGAALDFAIARSKKDKVASLSALFMDYERRIKQFYSQRYAEMFPPRIIVRDSLREFK